MKNLPEYNVMICHPANEYRIEFVSDRIKTLEGVAAHLPYGGTSGSWGDSGKGWTEQHGTPIGADIIFYAGYEDTFYHLDVDFPSEKMKDLLRRAYMAGYADQYSKSFEPYILSEKKIAYDSYDSPYSSMTDLIFGFAPKGMVVVWISYAGSMQIEIGRYQAKVIQDDQELEKKLFANWSMNRTEVKERDLIPDASPEKWDNYRIKYNWKPAISSENKDFHLLENGISYYNGEHENLYQPFVVNPGQRDRAVPKFINFIWESNNKENYSATVFFNWEKSNTAFKKGGQQQNQLGFKVAADNNSIEVTLNGQPLETDSIRMYRSNFKFPVD